MLKKQQLNQYLTKLFTPELLEKARKVDEKMANGLQIFGTDKIQHVVLGVSISAALINTALEKGADTIITHHGLKLSYPYNLILPQQALRLKLLLCNNLNLYAYHHVMDAHPTLGHSAQLAKLLGAEIVEAYFDDWGYVAKLKKKIKLNKLSNQLKKILDHDIFVVEAKEQVQTLGICSGGAIPHPTELLEIIEKKVDVHITGEIKESVPNKFLEMDVSYMACGHYATETLGMKALAKELKKQYKNKIKVEFIDIPNPL